MGMQMYLVVFKDEYSDTASREVQECVHQCGGFVLMVTRSGPIVALEDGQAPVVAKHPRVGFVGPVTLNPHGFAAKRLQQIFAENLSKQMQSPSDPDGGAQS